METLDRILRIAAVLLVMVCLVLASSATPARADSEVRVTTDGLNFRSEPSTDSSIITGFDEGTTLTVLDTYGDWYEVTYDGDVGYVKAEYVSASQSWESNDNDDNDDYNDTDDTDDNDDDDDIDPYSGSTDNGDDGETYVSSVADSNVGTVTTDEVRVRTGPGTGYDILGAVETGDTLTVVGTSGDWYQVSYRGDEGYIKGEFLSVDGKTLPSTGNDGSQDKSEEPAPTAKPVDTASATDAVDTTQSTGNDGNQKDEEQVSMSSASGTGTVNADYVRLRSQPSTSSYILDTLQPGAEMTVTGEGGDWYRVVYQGDEGYIYKTYLTVRNDESQGGDTTPAATSSGSWDVSNMDDTDAWVISAVHVRTGPDTSYTSLGVLSSGTAVTITGSTEKWYRVRFNGDEAYIFRTYLTTDDPAVKAANASSEGERIVAEAEKYLGVPYVYGGSSPSGFDCSGFVQYVFLQCGYSVTRTAVTQNSDGYYVSRGELQPGDIIIFGNVANTSIGHSGIYIGGGEFIHASSGGGRVMISELSQAYYDARFYGARRIVG